MDIEFKISKKPIKYEKALKLLVKKVDEVKLGGREFIWLLEHPTTFTAGIRSKKEEILNIILKLNIMKNFRNLLKNLNSK